MVAFTSVHDHAHAHAHINANAHASATCLGMDTYTRMHAHKYDHVSAGAITTLGRGGSDLTATVIAAALGVAEAQVWKDVDGEEPAAFRVDSF